MNPFLETVLMFKLFDHFLLTYTYFCLYIPKSTTLHTFQMTVANLGKCDGVLMWAILKGNTVTKSG